MNAKYRSFVSQYGTSAPKAGDEEALKAAAAKAENAEAPVDNGANAPATTRPEEPQSNEPPPAAAPSNPASVPEVGEPPK
jgi:hypothetical protein